MSKEGNESLSKLMRVGYAGGRAAHLDWVVREDLSEEVTILQSLEGSKEAKV